MTKFAVIDFHNRNYNIYFKVSCISKDLELAIIVITNHKNKMNIIFKCTFSGKRNTKGVRRIGWL